jgi:putative IMPACT (imprinted ancient) family translation regulator
VRLLTGEGVTNAALMVTRYFGGIKLGTGGLVRAYTAAAGAALESAGIVSVASGLRLEYKLTYPMFDKVCRIADKSCVSLSDIVYTDTVGLSILAGTAQAEDVIRQIEGVTAGAAVLVRSTDEDIYIDEG